MSRGNKGPMIVLHGFECRGLTDEVLRRTPGIQGEEILFWRGEVAARDKALSDKQTELDKAEVTIRNLEHEIRKLRRAVAELESGPRVATAT